ncbi:MAG: hypothetical protein ACREVA_03855 [Burkholderiales bacterium]
MKVIVLFCFAGILSFHATAITQTPAEAQFLSSLERVLKDKESDWDVKKIVLPPGIPPENLDNGSLLLSPRGKWRFYQMKSKQWAGAISVFYGDSQRDAANQFAWSLRNRGRNGNSLHEPIGDQAVQIVSKEAAEIMSRKANVCVSVRIDLVDLGKEDKSSKIEAKTAEALEITYRFTKHIVDQVLAN